MPDLPAWIAGHGDILLRTLREHVTLSLAALAVASAIALPAAVALLRWPGAAGSVLALVNALRAVPSLALLALLLPVLGTGFPPSLVALVLYGLPAILLNAHVGLRDVDRDVVEAARGQGLSDAQVLRSVRIPLALPVVFAGLRTAAVQVVAAATLAVFIGGGGLGELISAGMGLLDIPQLMVGAITIALLALATEILFGAAERSLSRTRRA